MKSDEIKWPSQTKRKCILSLLQRAYQLDRVWVVHGEFIRPYTNILVNEDKVLETWEGNSIFVIDFERGKVGDYSGKNMRSLSQWFLAQWYITILDCKKLGKMEREEMYGFLKEKLKDIGWPIIWVKNKEKSVHFLTGPRRTAGLSSFFFALLLLDQFTKYLFYNLQRWKEYRLFTPVFNTWIWWSIPLPWNLINIITAFIIFIIVWAWKKKYINAWIAVFLLSGAWGNLIDRVLWWWVRDFIDLHYRPIFNFADMYLSIAGILLIWQYIFFDFFTHEKKS